MIRGATIALLVCACGEPGNGTTPDDSDPGCAPELFVSPQALDFGRVPIMTSQWATIGLVNTGACPTLPLSPILGGSADFTLIGGSCIGYQLDPGGSCAIVIGFAPDDVGVRTADVAIDDRLAHLAVAVQGTGFPGPTLSPVFHDFGESAVGIESLVARLTLANPDVVPVSGISMAMTGSQSSEFAVIRTTCTTTLQPSATCTIDVAARAQFVGSKSAQLVVATDEGTVLTELITGADTAVPLNVSPSVHDFGSIKVGSWDTKQFVAWNPTNYPLGPVRVSTSGANGAEIELIHSTCEGNTLFPNNACTMEVRLKPTSAGPKTAQLDVSVMPGGTRSSMLSGVGLHVPAQVITPSVQNFGVVSVGITSPPKTFFIKNAGATPLPGFTTAFGGANPSEFAVSQTTCTGSLAPGDVCTIDVVTMTMTAGVKTASLAVTSSDGTVTASVTASSVVAGPP